MIKIYMDEHSCQAVRSNEIASSNWIAKALATEFRVDPYIPLKKMRAVLKGEYGLTGLHNSKLVRARLKAR